MADHRCGGKRGRVIAALTAVTGLPRRKRVLSKKEEEECWDEGLEQPYLPWEHTRYWGGASRMCGRVGQRFAGSQQSSLFLRRHNFLSSCGVKKLKKKEE